MSLDKNARVELETTRCEDGKQAVAVDRCGEPISSRDKQAAPRVDLKDLAGRLGEVLP